MQGSCLLMLVANFESTRLAYGGGRSRLRRDQVLGMRARRAGQAANDPGTVARWTVLMTGVSNVRVVGKTRTPLPRNDASIVVSVLSESANANAVEIAMEIESGTESTASASGTLSGIETDAIVSGTATGNETATETANEVTGTDGKKRIAIERAGRNATSAVERCSLLRTVLSPLDQVIVPPLQPRTRSGSEEDLRMMTYVFPLYRTRCRIHCWTFVRF